MDKKKKKKQTEWQKAFSRGFTGKSLSIDKKKKKEKEKEPKKSNGWW